MIYMEIAVKKINSAIKRKFIRPLNDGIKYNVNKLNLEKRTKYRETISLLTQSYETLNNIETLLDSGSLVDANALLRSSFEYILVGMMLQFEDNVFIEFINLSIDDNNGRDYTKIQKLINKFKTHLNEICPELFKNFNRVEKGDMLTELYDKLCKFTHSSVIVTTIVEIKNSDDKKILKMLNYQNFYFVKILLFYCLKYFTNDKKHYLYKENIVFSFLLYYFQVALKMKNKELALEKYDDLLYKDDNEKYFKKNDKYKEKMKDDIVSLNEDIDNEKFIELLNEFLN